MNYNLWQENMQMRFLQVQQTDKKSNAMKLLLCSCFYKEKEGETLYLRPALRPSEKSKATVTPISYNRNPNITITLRG